MVTQNQLVATPEMPRRPVAKTRQIGVRITEEEYAEFEKTAWKSGKTIGDWARDRLISTAGETGSNLAILTEIVSLQLFLTEALMPAVCGEQMSVEQYQELMRKVKNNKRRVAQDIIEQHLAEKQEASHG